MLCEAERSARGQAVFLVKKMWLVKVIPFGWSLLLKRKMPGLFPRMLITYVCSVCVWLNGHWIGRQRGSWGGRFVGSQLNVYFLSFLLKSILTVSSPPNYIHIIYDHAFGTLTQNENKQWTITTTCCLDDKYCIFYFYFLGSKVIYTQYKEAYRMLCFAFTVYRRLWSAWADRKNTY